MKNHVRGTEHKALFLLVLFVFFLLAVFISSLGEYFSTLQQLSIQRESETSSTVSAALLQRNLRDKLALATGMLQEEQMRNGQFQAQLNGIQGTVQQIQKVNATDKELLQKYSKVYFLNEHYAPAKLTLLDKAYGYDEHKEFYLATSVLPFFTDMVAEAKKDGVGLWIVSAYRSFDTQSGLKSGYRVTYGSGANAFSADQGYSEHQLGTTVDFTTTGISGSLSGFDRTKAYEWLKNNAHTYGFTLSYPPGNAYYIFEPWHWRFVGIDLASDLHRDGTYFYDLDQRKLDAYLISIFD